MKSAGMWQVHAEPGGRGQRAVQPDGAVLGRGSRQQRARPQRRSLLRQGARRSTQGDHVRLASECANPVIWHRWRWRSSRPRTSQRDRRQLLRQGRSHLYQRSACSILCPTLDQASWPGAPTEAVSGVTTGAGADRSGWHPIEEVETWLKLFFMAEFTVLF